MKLKLCPCGAVLHANGKECERCGRGKQHAKHKTTDAGYGWDWQQLRARFIQEHPCCAECQRRGITTAASEVHHVIPIAEAPWLRLEWKNLMSLCVPCHRAIEQARRQAGGGPNVGDRPSMIDRKSVV